MEYRGKLPRAPQCLGALPSLKNIKYTRMCQLKKLNIFSSEGPRENVFLGPTVALNVPIVNQYFFHKDMFFI